MKYLNIRIDNKLNWRAHIDDIVLKLIKASGMLYQVRDFVNTRILKAIYLVLYESHVHYACIIWGQNICTINCQKKVLRLIHFKERNSHTAPLFFKSKMVTLPDKIKSKNCLFIRKYVNNKLPPFNSWFIFPPLFISMKFHLQPKAIQRFLLLLHQHMVKEFLSVRPQKHGMTFKVQLKIP